MKTQNIGRLLLLGAIWGMSFMFMRVASPVFGPVLTTLARATLGSAVLLSLIRLKNIPLALRDNWRVYLTIGMTNTAIPFSLFAWAALSIPSAYMATMNAMAPLFTALFGAILLADKISPSRAAAFTLGVCGVGVLVGIGPAPVDFKTLSGVLAALLAAVFYGYAAIFTRRFASQMAPQAVAAGSQLCAALVLAPVAVLVSIWYPVHWPESQDQLIKVLGSVAMLGVFCTGVAYALFFRLIAEEGVSRALTVTFLVPAAATIWAALFLGEPITGGTVAGIAMVLTATGMALGLIRLPANWGVALSKAAAK